jgi:hypothetical protein
VSEGCICSWLRRKHTFLLGAGMLAGRTCVPCTICLLRDQEVCKIRPKGKQSKCFDRR